MTISFDISLKTLFYFHLFWFRACRNHIGPQPQVISPAARKELWPLGVRRNSISNSGSVISNVSSVDLLFTYACPVKPTNVQKSNFQSHCKHTTQQSPVSAAVFPPDCDHAVLIASTKQHYKNVLNVHLLYIDPITQLFFLLDQSKHCCTHTSEENNELLTRRYTI